MFLSDVVHVYLGGKPQPGRSLYRHHDVYICQHQTSRHWLRIRLETTLENETEAQQNLRSTHPTLFVGNPNR